MIELDDMSLMSVIWKTAELSVTLTVVCSISSIMSDVVLASVPKPEPVTVTWIEFEAVSKLLEIVLAVEEGAAYSKKQSLPAVLHCISSVVRANTMRRAVVVAL